MNFVRGKPVSINNTVKPVAHNQLLLPNVKYHSPAKSKQLARLPG